MPTEQSNERYANQFQSDQYQSNLNYETFKQLTPSYKVPQLNEYSEEELLKLIDDTSNLSDIESENLPLNSDDERVQLQTFNIPGGNTLRDVFQIVTPKYVANLDISSLLNSKNPADEAIKQISLKQLPAEINPNIDENISHYADQFNTSIMKERVKSNDDFMKGDVVFDGNAQGVDEAEKFNVPEQDVDEQETENKHKEDELFNRNEDETIGYLDVGKTDDETIRPDYSNILFSYSNFIPNRLAPHPNYHGKLYIDFRNSRKIVLHFIFFFFLKIQDKSAVVKRLTLNMVLFLLLNRIE